MHDHAGTSEPPPETADEILLRLQRQQVIGALADGIAHDSNNTLAAILANLDLALADPALPGHLQDRLTKVVAPARRAAGANARIQAFGRPSEARSGSVSLPELLADALWLVRTSLRRPRLDLSFPPPPADLWPVQANREQVMQVFLNLCLHARDQLPAGGQLEVRLANAVLGGPRHAAGRTGDFVTLTLRESGGAAAARLWNPFGEPASAPPDPRGVADWGIAVSSWIIARHGGWIETGTDADRHNYVKLFLPRAAGYAARLGIAAPANGHETVLVVDDDDQTRWMLRAILAYRGYTVLEAGGVQEAAERCAAAGCQIDAMLLKASLLEVPGAGFREQLRHRHPTMAIVLVADQDLAVPSVWITDGEVSILSKPFSSEAVLNVVRAALDAGQARRPA